MGTLVDRYLRGKLQALPEPLTSAIPSVVSLLQLANVRRIVYVTATPLLAGPLSVSQFFATDDQTLATKQRVLQVAGSLVQKSRDPLLTAIHRAALESSLPLREIDTDRVAGGGVMGKLDRTWFVLGGPVAMEAEGIELGVTTQALSQQMEMAGRQVLFLGQKQPKRLLAVFACEAPLGAEIREISEELEEMGIIPVLAATEPDGVARGLAKRAGIRTVHSQLSREGLADLLTAVTASTEPLTALVAGMKEARLLPRGAVEVIIGGRPGGEIISIPSLADLPLLLGTAREVVEKARHRFFWCTIGEKT